VSRAYYNEIDAYAAQWLRNLIGEGLIADGDVDTRSIADVTPNDVKGYTQCHFFAGLGGWSGALRLSGVWPDHRQVWTGSCPCQPFSLAGKQGGFTDERHLWPHWQYLIEQCGPAVVLGEQVASAAQWLGLVRGDLEAMGYAVGAIPVEAASAGADHLRDRYWFVADRHGKGLPERVRDGRIQREALGASERQTVIRDGLANTYEPGTGEERQQRSGEQRGAGGDQEPCAGDVGYAACNDEQRDGESDPGWRRQSAAGGSGPDFEWVIGADGKARRVKPGLRLLAHGVPARVAKLRALGNAIDLRPAAEFIKAVSDSI
jgi:DNA (cytosine-5)-methyltransferase 1